MGDKGADADHLGPELLHKQQIFGDIFRRLVRGTHHNPAAGLEPQFLQVGKAAEPVFQPQFRRMQLGIMVGGSRFVPQQVPVGPGFPETPVAFPAFFPQWTG